MARFPVLAVAAVALLAGAGRAADPLTTARAVRELPEEQAAAGVPVRLEATVFHVDRTRTVFLQDSTGGTFLTLGKTPFAAAAAAGWPPGTKLRVAGVTYRGLYVVGVKPESVEVVGRGPLPEPTPVTAAMLAGGRWHYLRASVEGSVRSVAADDRDGSVMRLATPSGPVEVRVGGPVPGGLVEARVAVVGLVAGAINDRRQLVRPFVALGSFADVTVLAPAPPDPFARPAVPVARLMRFDPTWEDGRRVKVCGVVTHHQPGAAVYLRDGDDAVAVEASQPPPLEPGDVVEALGFPRAGAFRAVLADAEVQKLEPGPPPAARDATADEARTGRTEADLIRLRAEVVEAYRGADGDVIAARDGETRFLIRAPAGAAAGLAPGAVVAATGISRVSGFSEGGYSLKPVGFELLARSVADLDVLARPPWWTTDRLLVALVLAAAGVTAAGAWAAVLQRQVRRQTAAIRERLAREAVLEERQRIARDVHDTLEQELVGLGLQLDAAAVTATRTGGLADPAAGLAVARRFVGRLHEEVRGLVWDLREDPPAGLAAALAAVAARVDGPVPVEVVTTGEPWPVPAVAHHNLVRLVQEAITNAFKHGAAGRVTVAADFDPTRLVVRVTDDGRGFDPDRPPPPGHYGLAGMRERAKKIGARWTVTSATGHGTTVEVTVPRPSVGEV